MNHESFGWFSQRPSDSTDELSRLYTWEMASTLERLGEQEISPDRTSSALAIFTGALLEGNNVIAQKACDLLPIALHQTGSFFIEVAEAGMFTPQDVHELLGGWEMYINGRIEIEDVYWSHPLR